MMLNKPISMQLTTNALTTSLARMARARCTVHSRQFWVWGVNARRARVTFLIAGLVVGLLTSGCGSSPAPEPTNMPVTIWEATPLATAATTAQAPALPTALPTALPAASTTHEEADVNADSVAGGVRLPASAPISRIHADDVPGQTNLDPIIPTPIPFVLGQTSLPLEVGVQINGCGHDPSESTRQAAALGFTWIKQQVRWADIVSPPGGASRPGIADWSCLDRVMAAARAQRLKVLFSVTTSPPYLRESHDTQGYPDDMGQFAYFVYDLLARYKGAVHGLEVWNEPNIDAEVSDGVNYARYAIMLSLGYAVAKYVDPNILVISAGLAPVNFDSFYTYVDDTGFLAHVFERDGLHYVDCIGAHANGPDGRGDINQLVPLYHRLTSQTKPVCVTELGYALGVHGQMPCGFGWAANHTPEGQARALVDGLKWARASAVTRLVIVWNLDVYAGLDAKDCNAPYALSRTDWQSPALGALADYLHGPEGRSSQTP